GGNWSNDGTITAVNSTVELGGTFTLATLGEINRIDSMIYLTGTLDNTNGQLHFDDLSDSWILAGGTISGGVISTDGSAQFLLSESSTLDAVTLAGNFTWTDANLRITNGLTLDEATLTLVQ